MDSIQKVLRKKVRAEKFNLKYFWRKFSYCNNWKYFDNLWREAFFIFFLYTKFFEYKYSSNLLIYYIVLIYYKFCYNYEKLMDSIQVLRKKIRAEKFNFSSIFKGNFLIVIIENTLTICEEKLFLYSLCI